MIADEHPQSGSRRPSTLVYRLVLAPLLIAAVVGIVYFDHVNRQVTAFRFLIAVVSWVAAYEFFSLCRMRGYAPAWAVGCLVVYLLAVWPEPALLLIVLVLHVSLKTAFRSRSFGMESAALTVLGCVFVGMLHFALVFPGSVWNAGSGLPTYYLLFVFFCAKGSDMAAFVAGKSVGRHRMAPVLSPKKTWEGAVAGGVVGTAAGMVFLLCTPLRDAYANVPVPALLVFSLLVTIASQAGDLVESAVKRWAGAKDSGRLLPGFGGMMDMVDSFFVAFPAAYVSSELMARLFA